MAGANFACADDATAKADDVFTSDILKTLPEIPTLTDPLQIVLYKTLKLSLEQDNDMKEIDARLAKLRAASKDKKNPSAEYLVSYKEGVCSVEGSAALLEQKQDIRSLASAELAWEKAIDERYSQLVGLFSSLIADMNATNYSASARFQSVKSKLVSLVGDSNTDAVLSQLDKLRPARDSVTPSAEPLSATEFSYKLKQVQQATQDSDPLLKNLLAQVDKKSHPSSSGAAQHYVSDSLNLLSYVPGGVGDFAGYAQMAYNLGEGSDDAKLLHAVYLYKRAEIRKRVITEASGLAMHNYESALQTKNAFLFAFAKSLVIDMGGDKAWDAVQSR